MASSLSEKCTPLKQDYDNCFNSWFEGYLEPAIATLGNDSATEADRAQFSKKKAEEFQQKCGKVWKEYRQCVQKAVVEAGLDSLLQQARKENPLVEPDTRPSPNQPS
ncbi:hypothetical protein FISHEDRAFT_38803 [Fistulina hepatica ATCC 64428]|uniref:Uncharacterized protein n=1 Tax=Fistulina hepatica ATCC 64428 TaxID=1128425 RepID=A0A0D7AI47_9AGAR|nr:hypothetical protein FISHEDRAFT_38803 [Fistulina hepatica ATCC 64428]